ncbi:response regulator [Microbulbifer spongiae]|uniref:Response regulator transcription factor n=1 Tax=Microbulbifer spongiae TaxID=2944933 RepID=A0ABY9E842_9GAMM|nr:response regulator transcription factor [Microbulbifer sp. MI-G]WKD48273.1 response regulator transcription factor [Microbulbifer sp. MI-G]
MSSTILIADDHPLYRSALFATLQHASDAKLIESVDLESTLAALARQADLDLLLLDLNMPGSDGYNGLARIRKEYPQVPVVVVSGSDSAESIAGAAQFGAVGFLSKTAQPLEIQNCIRAVLRGETWFAEELLAAQPHSTLIERLQGLTPQQLRIFQMIARGMLNKQIAFELGITEPTVKSHVTAILRKTGLRDRKQLIREAQSLGKPLPGKQTDASRQ